MLLGGGAAPMSLSAALDALIFAFVFAPFLGLPLFASWSIVCVTVAVVNREPCIEVTDTESSANGRASRHKTFSLRAVFLVVAWCALFFAILSISAGNQFALVLTLGTLIMGQAIWAWFVHRRFKPGHNHNKRQVRSKRALWITGVANIVPSSMWLLLCVN